MYQTCPIHEDQICKTRAVLKPLLAPAFKLATTDTMDVTCTEINTKNNQKTKPAMF